MAALGPVLLRLGRRADRRDGDVDGGRPRTLSEHIVSTITARLPLPAGPPRIGRPTVCVTDDSWIAARAAVARKPRLLRRGPVLPVDVRAQKADGAADVAPIGNGA